jgi:O-acetyl-ADP-ribose deacetylase
VTGTPSLPLIEAIVGDITQLEVDAIVNSANKSLMVGGGVDGAIHRAAGPGLELEARSRYGICPVGHAVITSAHNLKAKHVIHAVGPRYIDGLRGEPEALRSCYIQSLALADQHAVQTIAFPAISTGVYGYPKQEAEEIVAQALASYFADNMPSNILKVMLVTFG